MHDSQPVRRRFAGGFLILVIVAAASALLALPRPAAALGVCDGDNPPSSCFDMHEQTQDVTLTVSRSAGTITSAPAGISCGATCSLTTQRSRSCDAYECTDWTSPAYTLTAGSGPYGDAPAWGGACSGSASTCDVTLDADKTVSLGWTDVTNPSVALSSPSKTGPTMVVSAAASDNAGIAKVEFRVDGVPKVTDTTAPYSGTIDMSGYGDGTSHTVTARAVDTSNRITDASHSVTVDKSVSLSVDTAPAYTNAASLPIAFSTDSDVPAAGRQCQVNGGGYSQCSSPFSPPIPSDGSYTVTFKVTDDVGNTATTTRSFVVDRTNPAVSFTSGLDEGASVATADITVGFNATDATPVTTQCSLDGGAFAACTGADSEALSGLAPGSHSLAVRVTDSAGNATTITRHFAVVLPTPPATTTGGNQGGGSGVLGAGPTASAHKAKLSSSFKLAGKLTLVKSLKLSGLPSGAAIKVKCRGHGCPFRSRALHPHGTSMSLASLFKHKKLRKGVSIEIDVTAPGAAKQVFKLTTRAQRKPRLVTR